MTNSLKALLLAISMLAFIPVAANATAISQLTGATAANNIDNANNQQVWTWNSFTGVGPIFEFSSTNSTSSMNQHFFRVQLTSTNSASNALTVAADFGNGSTGTGIQDWGLSGTASHGSLNVGVRGLATNGGGGLSPVPGDTGVWGDDIDATGTTIGVLGTSQSNSGYGGYFSNSNGGYAAAFMGGNVGIGTATPQSLVQAYGGEVQVGSSGASCSAAIGGAIRFSGSTLYYCDGSSTWQTVGSGGTPALSSLTAATTTNTINNGNNHQTWEWNSLTGGPALTFSSTNTGAGSGPGGQTFVTMTLDGANANSSAGTTTLFVENNHTGTSSTNIGLSASASNGSSQNYGIQGYNFGTNTGDTGILAASTTFGSNGTNYGLQATNDSSAGYAGYFNNTGGGYSAAFMGGAVGIGTATPQSLVQAFGGEVQVGSSGASCSAAKGGAIRFSGSTLYYCDGTSTWQTIGSGGGGLPSLASGDIWVGNASNVATAVAMSGDCTLSNAGAITCTKTNGTAFGTLATQYGVNLSTQATGILPVANGGTGDTTLTNNGVLYGVGTSAIAATAQGGANTVLTANAGAPSFSGSPTISGALTTLQSIGTSSTNGIFLNNTTAATSTIQQYSPRVHWSGQGWKTNATAASQTVDFIEELQPLSGAASPSGNLVISSQVNGAGYNPLMTLTSGGKMGIGTASPAQALDVSGNIQVETGNHIYTNGGTQLDLVGNQIDLVSCCEMAFNFSGATNPSFSFSDGSGNRKAVINTNGSSYFNGGNVGIGTASPAQALDVSGNIQLEGGSSIYTNGGAYLNITGNQIDMLASGEIAFNNTGASNVDFSFYDGSGNKKFLLNPNGSSYLNGGSVGIGNTAPSHLLHVGSSSATGVVMELQNSSGACTYTPGASSVTVSCSSDIRLKTDVTEAKSSLAGLSDLRVHDYTIKATGDHATGVIAQEVMLNHPEMVHMGNDGLYTVDQPNPWKLVKAIQELKADNDNLRGEVAVLERTVARLETRK